LNKWPNEDLSEALHHARRSGAREPRLSAESRARIVAEVVQGGPTLRPWPALFAPVGRLLVAGALPLLLAGTLMLALWNPMDVSMTGSSVAPIDLAAAERPTVVHVAKVGDRVEFQIRNGKRNHFVSRSSDPDRFDRADRVQVTDGAYADRLSGDASLVFYRID
jgi:hypothetical protein